MWPSFSLYCWYIFFPSSLFLWREIFLSDELFTLRIEFMTHWILSYLHVSKDTYEIKLCYDYHVYTLRKKGIYLHIRQWFSETSHFLSSRDVLTWLLLGRVTQSGDLYILILNVTWFSSVLKYKTCVVTHVLMIARHCHHTGSKLW
jgi:hypothetical protein